MSSFTTELKLGFIDGKEWEVLEPFSFYMGTEANGFEITVPAGFKTDGASIPKPLHSIISPFGGMYAKAGILHDYLYKTGIMLRSFADLIFFHAMRVLGTNYIIAKFMYLAVRAFGFVPWNEHRENDNIGQT